MALEQEILGKHFYRSDQPKTADGRPPRRGLTGTEQEIAQQERVTKNGTNLRPADGPSTEWLARHFPPYRHSEGIGQQLGRLCVTPTSPPGLKPPALARSVRRLGQGHAITSGCALFVALLWFTLMTTTLLLTHESSALLGTNISVPDANFQPQSLLYALPTAAIGHRRCSPFLELHNFRPDAFGRTGSCAVWAESKCNCFPPS
jgi:hypothetical protein